jgi:Zn-dependent peptidase ImmA (M78 family)
MAVTQEAVRDATELLQATWDRNLEWCRLPIDPIAIAQSLGVKVFRAELESTISGLLSKQAGMDAVIFLNAADSPSRQRFTCAHELGHFFRNASDEEKLDYVDYRDGRAKLGLDADEVYANAFAAELLMPEARVRTEWQRSAAASMALEFGVSLEAMRIRLKTLGIGQ